MGLLRSSLAAFRDVQVASMSIFCDMLSLLGGGGGRGASASRGLGALVGYFVIA